MSAIAHTDAERAAIWHDVECGGYGADLSIWRALAADRPGPALELGCGTGRVALDLARHGTPMHALDNDPALIDALAERCAELPLTPVLADLTDFDLERPFSLVIAPMQVVQLLGGADRRAAAFSRVLAHLEPGGILALALVEGAPSAAQPRDGAALRALPDIAERDGWVYSSLPLGIALEPGAMVVRRLRQVVSPDGELSESQGEDRLDIVDAGEIEDELVQAGLRTLRRARVPSTDAHVGSLILVAEAPR